MTCCYYPMSVTTDDGELWTCGAGTQGQLGHADRAHQLACAQACRSNDWRPLAHTLELGHWRVVLDPGEGASQQAFSDKFDFSDAGCARTLA
jgi:hypothetical protein